MKITAMLLDKCEPTTIELLKRNNNYIDFKASLFLPAMMLPDGTEIALTAADADEPRRYKSRTAAFTAAVKLLNVGRKAMAKKEAKT